MASGGKRFFEFGKFRFDVDSRSLAFEDTPVNAPSSSLEALGMLLESRGRVVSREKLIDAIWAETFVEDANLSVAVSALRKKLAEFGGESCIQTVARKGYRFTAEIVETIEECDEPIVISRHTLEQVTLTNTGVSEIRSRPRTMLWAHGPTAIALIIVVGTAIFFLARGPVPNKDPGTEPSTLRTGTVQSPKEGANEAYLKGVEFWGRRTPEGLDNARKYFAEAVSIDPAFADAYVGLADAEYLVYDLGYDSSDEFPRRAKDNLLTALSLRPDHARALSTLGLVQSTYEWNWTAAESSLSEAVRRDPDSAIAHQRYAILMSKFRRFEDARTQIEIAQRIDPVSAGITTQMGAIAFFSGDHTGAKQWLTKAIELEPDFAAAHYYLAQCFWAEGRKTDAMKEWGRAATLDGDLRLASTLVDARSDGEIDAAVRGWRDSWSEQAGTPNISAIDIALLSANLLDRDSTLDWIERAFQQHSSWTPMVNAFPQFDFVRNEPRFQSVIKAMDLPH